LGVSRERAAPIEESRQQSQGDPCGWIDPSRLHAALDVERKLPTQEQILGLDRLARAKGESQSLQRFNHQLDQNPGDLQHLPIMP